MQSAAPFLTPGEMRAVAPVAMMPAPQAISGMLLHREALTRAGAMMRHSVSDEQWRRRAQTLQDWRDWSAQFPEGMQPQLLHCSPLDVISFLETWRESRKGRAPGMAEGSGNTEGNIPIAPSTLRSCSSRLSVLMETMNRYGPWSDERQQGNPCDHTYVKNYLAGYERFCVLRHNYAPAGAVPMRRDKMRALRQYLIAEAKDSPGSLKEILALRDLCAFQYLWETFQRGKECVQLLVTDLRILNLECGYAWEYIQAGTRTSLTYPIVIESSLGTKTKKTKYPGVIHLEPHSNDNEITGYFLDDLAEYGQAAMRQNTPITKWMFPSCDLSQRRLSNEPLADSSAMNYRLQLHLQKMSLWQGETLYSLRRGQVQDQSIFQGESLEQIAIDGLWKCPATVKLYAHPIRHEARLRGQT